MGRASAITLSYPQPDIAQLLIDLPDKGANILSMSVLDELAQHLDALQNRNELGGLIVRSGKPGMFIAGADLREFAASFDAPRADVEQICHRGQTLFGRLQQLPFVTVAAIEGICVGGGAELAVWCDFRVLADTPKTQIGFPEVKLGLFPGWGGTARLPRIVGLGNAVEMITSGEPVSARQACQMGLGIGPVAAERLLDDAILLVRQQQASQEYLEQRRRQSEPVGMDDTELAFLGATASAYITSQTRGQYPAPTAALEALLEGAGQNVADACQTEARGMAALFGTPVNRALINVFFLTDRNKKDPGVDRPGVAVGQVELVGVMGAGIMGSGIVAAAMRRDLPVVLGDAAAPALEQGARQALEEAAYDRETKSSDPQRVLALAPRLRLADGDRSFRNCDLVIEAVVENQQVKQKVLRSLEEQLPERAILTSNTSTIPITRLGQQLQRPQRFCGLHFFNPVRRMKLVEVIRGKDTDDETIATAVAFAKRLGKYPIVVNDGPGFLVNRLLFPYMNESLELLCEGAELEAIEKVAKKFGMPMGPIELYDMVGLDTALFAGRVMWEAFPRLINPSPLLAAMVKLGRLGRKTKRGFFRYDVRSKGALQVDPELPALIKQYSRSQRQFTADELEHRLFLPMVLEATRILADGIVRDVRDVDLGMIFGLGFPAFRGGLLWWADQVGAAQIVKWLEPFESLGERLRPTPLLLKMAEEGSRFYQGTANRGAGT